MSGRHVKPSRWRWLATLPPLAGLAVSAALLAWPAAASASTVRVTAAQLAPYVHARDLAVDSGSTVPQHGTVVRWAAAAEARLDARQEAARDARQAEARLDAQQAAEAAQDQAEARPAPSPPPVTVAPAATTGTFSYGQLESLWVSAGGPGWAEAQAAQIAECESGGNPDAYNPSGATGLWQILGQVVAGNLDDPMVNAENAVAKFDASGQTFAQWVCQ